MPPMCETMVLKPLGEEDIDEIKTNSALVVDKLAGMKYGSQKNYQQFLEEIAFDR